MKISIIIPIFNVEKYIASALNSVINQSYKGDIECILVDDSSPDRSISIANDIISKNSSDNIEFKVITHKKNSGLSAARNSGIDISTGEYLFFLDSDDEILPNSIELLASYINKHPNIDIVQGNILDNGNKFSIFTPPHLNNFYINSNSWVRENLLSAIPVMVWNRLIRRKLIIDNALYFKEGIIHEDEHWRFFASRHINSITFCTTPTYIYRTNDNSITTSKAKDKSYLSWLTIIEDIFTTSDRSIFNDYKISLIRRLKNHHCNMNDVNDIEFYKKSYSKFVCNVIKQSIVPKRICYALRYLKLPSWLIHRDILRILYK